MILLLAWRNIWRNKIRSLVVILSIAIGLWAGVFMMAFAWGMYQSQLKEVIRYELSHIQIHHPDFYPDRDVKYFIPSAQNLVDEIRKSQFTEEVVLRSKAQGMIMTPFSSFGVSISGIHPLEENSITGLSEMVIEGVYLDQKQRHKVLIGQKLAQKLKLRAKGKVVVMIQDLNGEIVSGAFRVCGIFKSRNSMFDERNIFIIRKDLNQLASAYDQAHEIAVLLKSDDYVTSFQQSLKADYPGLKIESWRELNPELDLILESFNEYMFIFIGIILLALMFGIINTQLMAVLERQKELGMLMAIGMNKFRLFAMILMESVFLALIGGPFGVILSYATVSLLHQHGINLSMFSEGLSMYGFGNYVYPDLEYHRYVMVLLMTVTVAIFSAVYPAWKALKLNPSEAIRKI